ncbi:MAG: hypothetical protein ABI135_12130 [Rhodoferax sp.]
MELPNTASAALAADEIRRRQAVAYVGGPAGAGATGESAVAWAAILAGAAAAAALALILLMLGTGLGLSAVSPWSQEGISATTFGVSTILWLTFTQIVASAMGGYLAGRLRTKWVAVHTDEVYFRDTAHGFLAWAIAALATAALLTSVIGSIVGTGTQTGATLARGVVSTGAATVGGGSAMAQSDTTGGPMGYFIDSLFRRDANAAPGAGGSAALDSSAVPQGASGGVARTPTTEVARIFTQAIYSGPLPAQDVKYVGQMVAQRTGLTQQDAEKRVTDIYARAQAQLNDAQTAAIDAVNKARKASAYAALWLFISLLVGAFCASLAATFGGRRRDI